MNRRFLPTALRLVAFVGGLAGMLFVIAAWMTSRRALSVQAEQESAIYDAGAVFAEDRPVIKHTFRVRNTSGRTIRLTDQLCACTCTTTKLQPDILGPGQLGTLDMSIVTTNAYSGETSMSCELRFDDGTSKQYALVYRLYPRMMADKEFLDFGTFSGDDQGPPPSIEVDVFLFAPPGRRLATLKSIQAPEEFEVERIEDATVEGDGVQQRRRRLRVRAKPQIRLAAGGGTFTKAIRFMADDGSTASANLVWRQDERFRCSPSPVSFGVVDPGGSALTRKAIISTSLDGGVRAEALESDSPHLKARAIREASSQDQATRAAERIELSLFVPADYQGDVVAGVVEARMDDDRRSTVRIPWSAIVRRPQTTDAAVGGRTHSD